MLATCRFYLDEVDMLLDWMDLVGVSGGACRFTPWPAGTRTDDSYLWNPSVKKNWKAHQLVGWAGWVLGLAGRLQEPLQAHGGRQGPKTGGESFPYWQGKILLWLTCWKSGKVFLNSLDLYTLPFNSHSLPVEKFHSHLDHSVRLTPYSFEKVIPGPQSLLNTHSLPAVAVSSHIAGWVLKLAPGGWRLANLSTFWDVSKNVFLGKPPFPVQTVLQPVIDDPYVQI